MNKEEFEKKKNYLMDLIKPLEIQLKELKKEYVDANQPFKIGEKVEVITPICIDYRNVEQPEKKRYAFVTSYEYNSFNDSVEVKLNKAKKDGTISKFEDTYSSREIITKIN
jgi:hypothetical protein